MKKRNPFICILFTLLLAVEGFFAGDLAWHVALREDMPVTVAWILGGGVLLVSIVLSVWKPKFAGSVSLGVLTAFLAALAVEAVLASKGKYQVPDVSGELFADHRVMVVVPHEDDDLNIMGGVMEQYTANGSEVYVVFVTNGDCFDPGTTRIKEAVACLASIGIPEDHVIFLGYGDGWSEGSPHIYNAPAGMHLTSLAGKTETYGTASHPAFNDGRPYLSEHYFDDMEQVIRTILPDIIFCNDLDSHPDHRAVSLCLEKSLGKILGERADYRPAVLKGFAYGTAWKAPDDFYAPNIRSAVEPEGDQQSVVGSIYQWSDRLRLPVAGDGLSRFLLSTNLFHQFHTHRSQQAILHAANVCNSDKVFWERSTASLSYGAKVTASSGDAGFVQDFTLSDCYDLYSLEPTSYDGIWIPAAGDSDRSVTLTLPEEKTLGWVCLYDNSSAADNILNAEICLDDGSVLRTGALNPGGGATYIPVDAVTKSVTVRILETEGEYAGLSEVELYETLPESQFSFIKLTDAEDNFVYDYLTGEETVLHLYHTGDAPALTEEDYAVTVSSGTAEIEDSTIHVRRPDGESVILTITSTDGRYRDSIRIANTPKWLPLAQQYEKALVKLLLFSNSYRFLGDIARTIDWWRN